MTLATSGARCSASISLGGSIWGGSSTLAAARALGSAPTSPPARSRTQRLPATAGNLSAWATHSTGLKTKGDGIKWDCCSDIESCEQCKYFPFAPYEVPKTDLVGLKACIFDNAEDRLPPDPSAEPFFFLSSKELASAWRAHGNVAETHFGPGGHCQIHSFYAIAKCLDDGTGRLCSEKGCTNETAIV
jgi:hypothetical protein